MRGGRQRQPGAARLERGQQDRRPVTALEAPDDLLAPPPGDAAVQERYLRVEPGRQVRDEQVPELGELGEAQGAVALREDLGEDLLQPHDLPGAAADRRAVVQQQRRVVADLLELGHRRQHVAAPGDAGGVFDLLQHVVDDRAIERGLLPGQPVVLRDLDLVGEVADDRRIGLEPAQQVGAGGAAQQLRGVGVPVPLDGDGEARPEPLGGAEDARVEHVHDRPELGEAVLHRGAGERDAVPGPEPADGTGRQRAGVLHRLGLVEHEAVPVDLGEVVGVAGGGRVGGDQQVRVCRGRAQVLAAGPPGPWWARTRRSGTNGRPPLPRADHRHGAEQQGRGRVSAPVPGARSTDSSASSWTVSPRPMSSARQAPARARRGTPARRRRAAGKDAVAR